MDDRTFDTLVTSFSIAAIERRGTIKGLLGAVVGLALGQIALPNADARKKKRRKKRKNKGKKKPSTPACTPECTGRECGDDGCGKRCGDCPDGYDCFDTAGGSICQAGSCEPDCAGKDCGADGCGGSCGDCQSPETCTAQGQCVCTPNCSGKQCGSNGCGGTCGDCPGGQTCNGGACCAAGQSCIGNSCWADSEELAFVTLINNHRAANGRSALALQNQLGRAAELHSQDQAANNFSSHTGSDGSEPDERIADAGYDYSWWGENIYYGGGTASDAFTWWKNSQGHNDNMLSTNFTEIGIGRALRSASGVWYWTTTFGQPR